MTQLLEKQTPAIQFPSYFKNQKLRDWVSTTAALTKPDHIHFCEGTDAEYNQLCELMVASGTFKMKMIYYN